MSNIAIYTLTSALHDEAAVAAATKEFLDSLGVGHLLMGADYATFGTHALDLIYVRTGGTEGIFNQLLPELQRRSRRPFYLLTSGKSNSLAASMEILSFLRRQGIKGEIIHGSTAYVAARIRLLASVGEALQKLDGCRLGIVGKPSDWLISSEADPDLVRQRLGIELLDIAMDELLDEIKTTPLPDVDTGRAPEAVAASLAGAEQIHLALRALAERHRLGGLTVRCFDLLTAVRNTGCLALAKLNADGIVAGCEGDVPALLTMTIVRALLDAPAFQANPARIDAETGEVLFAHCTIPLSMVDRYEFDTHFESGIGVGIRGYMHEGPVTIVKVAGDLSRAFIAEGELVRNQAKPDLCRTQQVIRLDDKSQCRYFLTDPIGNHHIIIAGHHRATLEEILM